MNRIAFTVFSWAVLGWNLLVILWGAFVRATGSGAGCGSHWPLCNGEVLPKDPATATLIEFSHRLTSGIAILLVFAMLVWGWRLYSSGHPVRLGLVISSLFIVIEALLGASLVLFGWVAEDDSAARAVVMAIHLANTFILVGALALTAYWAAGGLPVRLKDKKRLPWLLGLGLFGVLVIGASGAVTALGDTLFPAGSLTEGLEQKLDPEAHFLIRLRVYHPLIAILVSAYTYLLLRGIYNRAEPFQRRMIQILASLLTVQLAAGLTNLILLAPISMQLIHLFLADGVWIAYVLMSASLLAER
jgi:heme A synthase